MAVPSNRVPVRVARGLKSALVSNLGDLLEGELLYAKDEDKLYMVEGGALVPMGSDLSAASIDELSDVDTSTVAPTEGQVLTWDNTAGQWEPATPDAGITRIQDATDFQLLPGNYPVWNVKTGSSSPAPGEWYSQDFNAARLNPVDSNGTNWSAEMAAVGTGGSSNQFWYSTNGVNWTNLPNNAGGSSSLPNWFKFDLFPFNTNNHSGSIYISFSDPATTPDAPLVDGQVLEWDSAGQAFQPATRSTVASIDDLTDVTITAAATGEVLRYNGSAWVDAQLSYNDLSNLPTLGTAAAAATTDFATAAQGTLADSAVQPTDSIDVLADVDTTTAAPTNGQVLEWNGTNWVPATPSGGGAVSSVNGQTGAVVLELQDLDNVSLVPDPGAPSFTLSGPSSSNPSSSGEWGLDTVLNNYFTWYTLDPIHAWIDTLTVGHSVEFVTQGGYTHVGVITTASTVNGANSKYISFANDPWPQQLINAKNNNESITVQEVGGGLLAPTDGQVLTWVAANSRWEPADATGGGGGGLSGVGVATRASDSGTAASSALTLTGLGSSGQLHTISTDLDAWVVFYGSAADRTADAGRGYGTDPTPGSGVLAEAYVTTAGAVLFTPGTMYMNNDTTETSAVYLAVRDQAGAAVNATLTVSAYVSGGYTGVSGGTFGSG